MTGKETIKGNLELEDMILGSLLADLSDDDLKVKPAGVANPFGFQLGHLIAAERRIVEDVCPGCSPALPEGFADAHSKAKAEQDDYSGLLGKEAYLALLKQQRAATLQALDDFPDEKLNAAVPHQVHPAIPTYGRAFALPALHQAWHVGQLSVLRRQLGKPVVI